MDSLLLNFFFFLRPATYLDITIGGWGLLELFAMSFLAIMVLLFIAGAKSRTNRVGHSWLDIVMYAYIFWCFTVYLAYLEKSQLRDALKFALPFFTFIVVKNSIRSREQFIKYLKMMLIGFSIPIIVTTILIAAKQGLDDENYWTGILRYKGAYPNPHDLGHNMALFIMIAVLYWVMRNEHARTLVGNVRAYRRYVRWNLWVQVLLGLLVALALFSLYKSVVRTAFLGLAIFVFLFLFFYNKKWLLVAGAAVTLAVVLMWSVWSLIFFDVVQVYEGKQSAEHFGSGRPEIWEHNWKIFSEMPIDRQLAGVGIGNRGFVQTEIRGNENIWNSHNDFLEVMIQTGYIGIFLYLVMQILILAAILRVRGRERYVFFAIFVAVTFMNFSSNSYVSRVGLGQELYMILAYIQAVPAMAATGTVRRKISDLTRTGKRAPIVSR